MSDAGDPARREPLRVLIVLLGALGDVVRGLTVVDALRMSQQEIRITWLVERRNEPMVRLHPAIDEVVVFDRKRWWYEVPRLARELRGRFDVTLDLQRHFKSGVLSWISGSRRRIGFNPDDAKEFNWIFNTEFIPAHGERISKVDHYLEFVWKLGGTSGAPIHHGLRDAPRVQLPRALEALGHTPSVVLALGSSWDSKDWLEEGYGGLIGRLLESADLLAGTGIVLVGDSSKVEMARRLSAGSHPRVVNVVGETTLGQLVEIIRGATVCVGPDSGPAHIAGALGTPYIALFGPTPAIRNAPRGSEHLAISSRVGCSPCKRRRCPGLGKVCMRLISPDMVLSTIREVFEESGIRVA